MSLWGSAPIPTPRPRGDPTFSLALAVAARPHAGLPRRWVRPYRLEVEAGPRLEARERSSSPGQHEMFGPVGPVLVVRVLCQLGHSGGQQWGPRPCPPPALPPSPASGLIRKITPWTADSRSNNVLVAKPWPPRLVRDPASPGQCPPAQPRLGPPATGIGPRIGGRRDAHRTPSGEESMCRREEIVPELTALASVRAAWAVKFNSRGQGGRVAGALSLQSPECPGHPWGSHERGAPVQVARRDVSLVTTGRPRALGRCCPCALWRLDLECRLLLRTC